MTAIGRSDAHRLGDRRDELRVEPVDGDGDPAAAGEADVEAVLVVEPVVERAARASRSSTSLASRITAGSTQPPVTPPATSRVDGDGERGAGVARGRADPLDDRAERDRGALARPALQDLDDVFHRARALLLRDCMHRE